MLNKRKTFELFITSNVHRLSAETLERVAKEMESEVYESIDKELESVE